MRLVKSLLGEKIFTTQTIFVVIFSIISCCQNPTLGTRSVITELAQFVWRLRMPGSFYDSICDFRNFGSFVNFCVHFDFHIFRTLGHAENP